MEAIGSFFDGGFWKARDLEEAPGDSRVPRGVESGRGFGLVGSDGSVRVERSAGADIDFNVVKGAGGFDDSEPVEGRAGFWKRGGFARRTAAGSGRVPGGPGLARE